MIGLEKEDRVGISCVQEGECDGGDERHDSQMKVARTAMGIHSEQGRVYDFQK